MMYDDILMIYQTVYTNSTADKGDALVLILHLLFGIF